MISAIVELVAKVAGGIAEWARQYGGNKPTEARRTNEEQKKLDDFRTAISQSDLDKIRKALASRSSGS